MLFKNVMLVVTAFVFFSSLYAESLEQERSEKVKSFVPVVFTKVEAQGKEVPESFRLSIEPAYYIVGEGGRKEKKLWLEQKPAGSVFSNKIKLFGVTEPVHYAASGWDEDGKYTCIIGTEAFFIIMQEYVPPAPKIKDINHATTDKEREDFLANSILSSVKFVYSFSQWGADYTLEIFSKSDELAIELRE